MSNTPQSSEKGSKSWFGITIVASQWELLERLGRYTILRVVGELSEDERGLIGKNLAWYNEVPGLLVITYEGQVFLEECYE